MYNEGTKALLIYNIIRRKGATIMSIGSTIKSLRRERNMTQEQLAELLGVSTNAVSQWECDKTAPDISNLPLLASIFEVSADILLEIDVSKSKKQAEIKEFIDKHSELHSRGKTEERLKLCREMQKKYPNDETVRYYLMRVLQNGYTDECFDEIVALGEQLLNAAELKYRTGAIRGLCFTYLHKGDRETALKYANMIPPTDDLRLHVLEGKELVALCQDYFLNIGGQMYLYMKYLLECEEAGYTYAEKHRMWETLYEIFHLIFNNGDFGFWNARLSRICFHMALLSAKAGQYETALEELELMAAHTEKLADFSEIEQTSLLINKVKYDLKNTSKSSEESLGRAYLRYLNNNEDIFTAVKDDDRYLLVKERLAAM